MARVKIDLPDAFPFITQIPIRITDLNYGGHVGNDNILSIMHEARVQFLKSVGYTEMNVEGAGLIMSAVAIEFKNELFYEDVIHASVAAGEFTRIGFDIFYKLERQMNGKNISVVVAKTAMVCYNYDLKKIVSLSEKAKNKLSENK
ncbi:MAG: acyl-CoA thioesterase [Bacteroidetes bacterium]|nr:acyl-CoA thioesterase [Bacteroidota bacterium]